MPFVYSQDDLDALLEACGQVFSDERIAATMRTAIGVLAATGLRIGEALSLCVDDIDHVNNDCRVIAEKETRSSSGTNPSTASITADFPAAEVDCTITANGAASFLLTADRYPTRQFAGPRPKSPPVWKPSSASPRSSTSPSTTCSSTPPNDAPLNAPSNHADARLADLDQLSDDERNTITNVIDALVTNAKLRILTSGAS